MLVSPVFQATRHTGLSRGATRHHPFVRARVNSIRGLPGLRDFITACSNFNVCDVCAWKGAYHVSPDFAHWHGWAHLQLSLIEIKEESRKLRELAKLKKIGLTIDF